MSYHHSSLVLQVALHTAAETYPDVHIQSLECEAGLKEDQIISMIFKELHQPSEELQVMVTREKRFTASLRSVQVPVTAQSSGGTVLDSLAIFDSEVRNDWLQYVWEDGPLPTVHHIASLTDCVAMSSEISQLICFCRFEVA